VLLPVYLLELGFSVIAIGAIVTATLFGSALLTLGVGIFAHRHKRRLMLLAACALMTTTGAGFALTDQFWPLVPVGN
jgi:predicted MFS family arabinose efflux permease